MSLSGILKLLGSGEIGSVVNVLSVVVHGVMEEFELLRGDLDGQLAQCLEAMNRAEGRSRGVVEVAVMVLATRMDGLSKEVTERMDRMEGMLTEVSRLVDGGGTLEGYEAERKE